MLRSALSVTVGLALTGVLWTASAVSAGACETVRLPSDGSPVAIEIPMSMTTNNIFGCILLPDHVAADIDMRIASLEVTSSSLQTIQRSEGSAALSVKELPVQQTSRISNLRPGDKVVLQGKRDGPTSILVVMALSSEDAPEEPRTQALPRYARPDIAALWMDGVPRSGTPCAAALAAPDCVARLIDQDNLEPSAPAWHDLVDEAEVLLQSAMEGLIAEMQDEGVPMLRLEKCSSRAPSERRERTGGIVECFYCPTNGHCYSSDLSIWTSYNTASRILTFLSNGVSNLFSCRKSVSGECARAEREHGERLEAYQDFETGTKQAFVDLFLADERDVIDRANARFEASFSRRLVMLNLLGDEMQALVDKQLNGDLTDRERHIWEDNTSFRQDISDTSYCDTAVRPNRIKLVFSCHASHGEAMTRIRGRSAAPQ